MFIHEMRQTWRLVIISIFFCYWHHNHVLLIVVHVIDELDLQKKNFSFHHFPYSKSSSVGGINLDTHNNLHSFRYGHYNNVLLVGIHNIGASNLQEKLFFPPFSLLLKLILEMRQAWVPVICSILFVMGTTIMFTSLEYTILMLCFGKKSFSFHHFPYY